MSKLEDNVNEILGIEKRNSIQVSEFEQPRTRKIDENKQILITITQ